MDRCQVDLTWCIEQLNVGLLGNAEVEVKAVLAFHGFLKEEVKIRCPQEMICLRLMQKNWKNSRES